MPDPPDVAQLFDAAHAGDKEALNRLFAVVYAELRRLADACLRAERPSHTLQRTALVHEAYLRLREQNLPPIQDRAHFLKLVTRIMRQILVDHARHRNMQKRSADLQISLDDPHVDAEVARIERPARMIRLDDALSELEKRDERKARLIELRYFSGLTAEESASILALDVLEVRRELRLAQAWLKRELGIVHH